MEQPNQSQPVQTLLHLLSIRLMFVNRTTTSFPTRTSSSLSSSPWSRYEYLNCCSWYTTRHILSLSPPCTGLAAHGAARDSARVRGPAPPPLHLLPLQPRPGGQRRLRPRLQRRGGGQGQWKSTLSTLIGQRLPRTRQIYVYI